MQDDHATTLKVFYLILVHNDRTADDAIHLIRSIRHPSNTILIHVDTKVAHLAHDSALQREVDQQRCCDYCCGGDTARTSKLSSSSTNIRIESVHSVEWSKWSMNLPTLWGMEMAIHDNHNDWDVFVNLSGDTLPVYDPTITAQILAQLPYNFVTSKACETGFFPTSVFEFPKVWHKRRHYTQDETESDPVFVTTDNNHNKDEVSITVHFGSQWVILQRDFVEWLYDELAQQGSWVSQFRDYLQASGKLMTDETFIPTVLMYAPERFQLPLVTDKGYLIYANGTVSSISNLRYERMDEHFPTARGIFPNRQRYQIPQSLLHFIDQPRVWGPYFLGVYDLGDIRTTGALYARKISTVVDDNMHRLLPVHHINDIPDIHWPTNELSIIDKPDWSKEREMFQRIINTNGILVASEDGADDAEL